MIIFSFKEVSEKLSTTVNSFLEVYGSNPLIWTLILAIIIVISFWGISNLSNK